MQNLEQRAELHRKIWAIADDVRGAVDGWDFKQYILGILFYRFISEDLARHFDTQEREAGNLDFDYSKLSDDEAKYYTTTDTIDEKGYAIFPSQLFCNVVKTARKNPNLNVDLYNIFRSIEQSSVGCKAEEYFKGLFEDLDTRSSRLGADVKEKSKRLADILVGISEINFGEITDSTIDIFGDAYEYLISNYAKNAGKSGGEFFTPQSVSNLLARIVTDEKTEINKVYDPTCGSGSLLLQVKKEFQDKGGTISKYCGQEINMTTYNLARMNMFLHKINYNDFSIKQGDTLTNPLHKDEKPFDAIVSNPPYSIKWQGDSNAVLIDDDRFSPAGVLAPKNFADFAFIMHSINHLSSSGKAAIICFPGIFYRQNAEAKIRKYLIEQNFIEAIIALPDNLFFGTSIATCVLVMSKHKKDTSVLFIDASKEFKKETNNNILSRQNIENIMQILRDRESKPHLSALISDDEIKENNYNLSVSNYVEKEDLREVIDIKELNLELKEIVARIDELRARVDKIVKKLEI